MKFLLEVKNDGPVPVILDMEFKGNGTQFHPWRAVALGALSADRGFWQKNPGAHQINFVADDGNGEPDPYSEVLRFVPFPASRMNGNPFDNLKSGTGIHFGVGGAFGDLDDINWVRK